MGCDPWPLGHTSIRPFSRPSVDPTPRPLNQRRARQVTASRAASWEAQPVPGGVRRCGAHGRHPGESNRRGHLPDGARWTRSRNFLRRRGRPEARNGARASRAAGRSPGKSSGQDRSAPARILTWCPTRLRRPARKLEGASPSARSPQAPRARSSRRARRLSVAMAIASSRMHSVRPSAARNCGIAAAEHKARPRIVRRSGTGSFRARRSRRRRTRSCDGGRPTHDRKRDTGRESERALQWASEAMDPMVISWRMLEPHTGIIQRIRVFCGAAPSRSRRKSGVYLLFVLCYKIVE